MKVLRCLLLLVVVIVLCEVSRAEDKDVQSKKLKRPFCNAFMGCSVKRPSSRAIPTNLKMSSSMSIYRLFARLATMLKAHEMRMKENYDRLVPDRTASMLA